MQANKRRKNNYNKRGRNVRKLVEKINELSLKMEKMKLNDYVYFMQHPAKMIWPNFLAGLSRGFGIAVGFSILGALLIYILQYIITLNLPGISAFIGKIVEHVEYYLDGRA